MESNVVVNPAHYLQEFIRAVNQWELDTKGDTEEIVVGLYKLRDNYRLGSVGFRFVTEAINFVEDK